jgi:hypothetical protein
MQNVDFSNDKLRGTYSYHWALKGLIMKLRRAMNNVLVKTCRVYASLKKTFPAQSLNMASKNVILTAVYRIKNR